MKQIIVDEFGGVEKLRIADVPTPEPGPGQVRIRFTSIGLNHAELMARRGEYKLTSGDPPFTPGLEGGGVIDALGHGVLNRHIGDRVVLGPEVPRPAVRRSATPVGRDSIPPLRTPTITPVPTTPGPISPTPGGGTYRSHYLAPAAETWPAPSAIPDDQLGSLWLTYLTAWGCLVWKQKLRSGDFVALPAASSGVALAAAQVVRRFGGIAIGLTSRQEKIDRLRALPTPGFDHLVLTHAAGQPRPWQTDLKDLTKGHGIDVFFDPVAAGDYLSTEIRALAQHGTIWVYGLLGRQGPVDIHPLIRKYAAVRGWALNELVQAGPEVFGAGCRHILEGFASGAYRQHVDRVFSLDEVRDAHAYMERGEHIGKIVMAP